jgi:hypothetical protein
MLGLTSMPVFISAYFYIAQMQIEDQMEQALESENLQEISIPTNEIIWLKKDKEILVGNQLFDVKNYQQQGSFTLFKGLIDSKEKELKSKLLACTTDKESTGKKQKQLFRMIFSTLFFLNKTSFNHWRFSQKQHQYAVFNDMNIADKYASLISPPPRNFQAI